MLNFDNNPNQEEKVNQALLEIIHKYNLKETEDQILEKFEKGEELNDEVILNVAEKIIQKELQENNAPLFLEKQLKISEENAKKIFKEIKEKVLPLIEGVPFKSVANEEEKLEPITPIRPPTDVEKIIKEEPSEITPKIISRTKKTIESEMVEKVKAIKKMPKKNDAYREPIE